MNHSYDRIELERLGWSDQLDAVVGRLPEAHRVIVRLIFGLEEQPPLSEDVVAAALQLPVHDVRAVCDEALRILRSGRCGAIWVQ